MAVDIGNFSCLISGPKLCLYLQTKLCIMGISGHFGIENYVCKVAIVQNRCEYCRCFMYDFSSVNVIVRYMTLFCCSSEILYCYQ